MSKFLYCFVPLNSSYVKCSLSANNNFFNFIILLIEESNSEVAFVVGFPVDAISAIMGCPVFVQTAKKLFLAIIQPMCLIPFGPGPA